MSFLYVQKDECKSPYKIKNSKLTGYQALINSAKLLKTVFFVLMANYSCRVELEQLNGKTIEVL